MQFDDYNYGYLCKDANFQHKEVTLEYEFSQLKAPQQTDFTKAIPITEIWKTQNFNQGVHFYVHDKFFIEYLDPKKAQKLAKRLRKFNFVISPDFSILGDAPEQNKLMNISRNLNFASFLQAQDVNVVANVRCLGNETYQYAFVGIPKNSTIAIGSYGSIRKIEERQRFYLDFDETIKRLSPKTVIIYGAMPDDLISCPLYSYQDIEFIHIENYTRIKIKKSVLLRQQKSRQSDDLQNNHKLIIA